MDTWDGSIFFDEPSFNLGDQSGAYLHAAGSEDKEPCVSAPVAGVGVEV
jgi:hypothetical protein